ncbi:MAG: hypothetical protein HKN00_01960 [Flavobacteriaceae bacterium]|nr:hypothetical protein [Bacteroidia bacterium]MBT8287724.1 hypothetical protein [Bacteroidia bacterium]NNF73919.1 hypothetical protein [Flavobacteriaceae bacterium]NNK71855.1 hypothetical protein [Flavobacteriaceae bacterium]
MAKAIRLLFFLICFHGFGQLDLIETTEMKLVTYDYGHKYILPHATRCFHKSLEFHKRLFDYVPSERITILIQDFGDFGNAGATAVPKNAVSMGLSPFSYAFETNPAGERVFSMMNHELIHVVALDNAAPSDRFFRSLFLGKVDPSNAHPESMFYSYLTTPRRYSPRWYHEGLASYLETWMSGGLGLALGSYDEMVFRTKVLEGDRIYSPQGLESEGVTSDFQGRSNSYLYGTRFMGYLAYYYSPEKLIEWGKRGDNSKRSFSGQFRHVFGKSLDQAWDDWIAFEKEWQQKNIDKIKNNPVTEPELITDRIIGSVSYPQFDRKRNIMYMAVNFPGQIPHIASMNLSDGSFGKLTDIKGAALFYVSSLIYDQEHDVLYYTTDNDQWRDLNSYDLKTGKSKRLQKDFRTGDLAFNKSDEAIWGIKHLNGRSSIVKIPKENIDNNSTEPYSTWERKHTLDYGHDIFDIDISPDGKKLSAAVSDLVGNQALILYDVNALERNEVQADTIYNFKFTSPQSFRFSEDGKFLTGCAYVSGVNNIFRVNMESMNIEVMSNAVTGFFRPLIIDDESVFVFNYSSKGFQPALIPNEVGMKVSKIDFLGTASFDKHPVLESWELDFPRESDLDVDSITINTGTYKAGQLMQVNYGYPTVTGYKDNIGIGYHMNISDALSFKSLDLSIAYTPKSWRTTRTSSIDEEIEDDEVFHFSFDAKLGSYHIHGGYNEANFYDLFGPTKFSRKGYVLNINYDRSLLWDSPKNLDLSVGAGAYYDLDQSPAFQQIESKNFDETFFFDFNVSLAYRNLRNSLGAVDHEKGIKTSIGGSMTLSSGRLFPRAMGTFDYGFQLPVNHASLWIRNSLGYSFSKEFNPFTRYAFAAFGNNYIDYRSFRQYRSPFSFPGLGFDEDFSIIARAFNKNMLELVLPPIRIRKLGTYNFFTNWIQPTIFGSFLWTDNVSNGKRSFADIGVQVDTRFVLFALMPSTVSVGYARAWDLDADNSFGEFMISLKLLK